jgi:hypothetical protein
MKKLVLFILVLFSLVSCQEETSSDAKSDKKSSEAKTNPYYEGEGVKYFKVMSTAREDLSHYIHKTGVSNKTEECKITTTDKFSTSDVQEIDCFLEVEELDLFYNGANLTVASSKGICEHIAYVPFSFYRFLPGNSSRTVNVVDCPADCGPTGTAQCVASNPSTSCTYDYSDDNVPNPGPNCDLGVITINTTTYTYDSDSGSCSSSVSTAETSCNGDIRQCIDGHVSDLFPDRKYSYYVHDTNGENFDYEYKIKAPHDLGFGTNQYIANYTRMCGGPANNTINGSYTNLFTYDADDIDAYGSGYTAGAVGGVVQYAEDPFQGIISTSAHYAFYCLDQAFDVKARIRIMIRDWDREFSTSSSSLELVSDISTNATMDASGTAGLYQWFDEWNDKNDWDDHFSDTDNLDSSCSGFGANKYTSGAFPGYGL